MCGGGAAILQEKGGGHVFKGGRHTLSTFCVLGTARYASVCLSVAMKRYLGLGRISGSVEFILSDLFFGGYSDMAEKTIS